MLPVHGRRPRPETLGTCASSAPEPRGTRSSTAPGTPIHVELDVSAPDRVSGEVVTHGDPAGAPHIHERPGAHGGYGLRLVDALSREWGVREASTDVWFELGG